MWNSIFSKVVIAVVSSLATAGILWIAAKSGGLIEQVFIPELPGGAVVAFDGKCPINAGWVPYEDGAGKVVLGAGSGTLRFRGPHRPKDAPHELSLTPVALGDQGGEEQHTLSPKEMPSHDHPGSRTDDTPLRTSAPLDNAKSSQGDLHPINQTSRVPVVVAPQGGDAAHNNMPPYIALYFCKKE